MPRDVRTPVRNNTPRVRRRRRKPAPKVDRGSIEYQRAHQPAPSKQNVKARKRIVSGRPKAVPGRGLQVRGGDQRRVLDRPTKVGGKVEVRTESGVHRLSPAAYRKAVRQSARSARERRHNMPETLDDTLKPKQKQKKDEGFGLNLGTLATVIPKPEPLTLLGKSPVPKQVSALNIVRLPGELARATAESPGKVTSASVKSGVESIAGIPQGVKMLATHPEKALHEIAKDYERRYGSLLEGDSATFRKRVKEDYGVTPYALDAAAAIGGSGQTAGAAARSGAVGRLATALERSRPGLAQKAGRAARRVHETTTRERPNLRISAGETGVKPQRTSKNLLVAPAQHRLDKSRAARFGKEAEGAGLRPATGGRLERIPDAKPGRLRAVRPGEGEVLPYLSPRESPVIRRLVGRTERAHGRRKSNERLRLLTVGGQVEKAARKQIDQLDKKERAALKYVETLGLSHKNRAAAVRALEKYKTKIETEGRVNEGKVSAFEPDELPTIEAIIADPEGHITPRVRAVADELRTIEHGQAAQDPELTQERAADRRLLPASMVLDERRAPDVGEFHDRLRALEQKIAEKHPDQPPPDLVARFGHIGKKEPLDRLEVIKDIERGLRKAKGKAERAVPTAEREAARVGAVVRERQTRGKPLETPEVRQARAELAVAKRARKRQGRGLTRTEYATGATHGRASVLGSQQVKRWEKQVEEHKAKATKAIEKGDTAQAQAHLEQAADLEKRIERGASTPQLGSAARAGEKSLAGRSELQQAENAVRDARARLDAALEKAPRVGERVSHKQRQADMNVIHKRAVRDDVRMEHKLAAMVRKEIKTRPGRYEDSAAFQARMEKAMTEAGLEAPGYWESTGGAELRRSVKAIGTGVRGAAGSKEWSGKRFLAGRESNDPEVIINGLLRNAKRRFSWRYTITTVNQSAFEWSRGPHGGGRTAAELQREIESRHMNPDDLEFVNVRVLEDRELDAEGLERGQVVDPAQDASPDGGIHPDDLGHVREGLVQATSKYEALLREATDVGATRGQAMNRYLAIPSRDHAELAASMRPDGPVGRGIDILWKQKPARILLGLANTSWLAFQMMANGLVAGLGGALNPFDYPAAGRWWKTLTPEQKLAIEPELGITHHHHAVGQEQTHMGAATNARFVNAWRAFKQTKVMRTLHKGNPLDLMFRADEAQNNFFRRAVFYNQAKRDTYKRMGASWTSAAGAQKKIMQVFSIKRPDDRMAAIIENAPVFEKHAEHVREWLGDYLTYTTRERQTIARAAMFYGYLRFSLRMVFWTMPVKHPIMAAILGDLGRMGSQEVKRLLGLPDLDKDGYRSGRVPTSMLAQAYYGTPAGLMHHKPGSGSINFGRMNPFLNAITQMEDPQQVAGLFSPVFQAEIDQMFRHSSFLGRDWRIEGRSTPDESSRPKDYFGSFFEQLQPAIPGITAGTPRGRILERQLLSLAAPYRHFEESGSFGAKLPLLGKVDPLYGSQSDDSLLWEQRPMHYAKGGDAEKGTSKARRQEKAGGTLDPAIRRAFPLLGLLHSVGPQPTSAPVVLKREREKAAALKKGKKKKRKTLLGGSRSSGKSLLDGPSSTSKSLLDK